MVKLSEIEKALLYSYQNNEIEITKELCIEKNKICL